jgi:hypothetical protein
MQVRALRNGDIEINGEPKALFAGQIYDLAEPLVQENDWLEVVPAEEPEAEPPVEEPETVEKAVEEAPKDKAVRTRRTKSAE